MTASLRTVKLAEIADLNPVLREVLRDDDQVAFIPMAAVDAETATTDDSASRYYSDVRQGYTSFVEGDVLVAKITPCFENGKIAQARLGLRIGFGSTEFHVVRPHPNQADARYVLHFLRQDRVRLEGERKMTGSAGQRRVPEHFLAGLRIPLPPLPEQRRISEILDRVEALRAKRRAAFAQLDTLTRAIFLDMFGDPAINPKGWPRVSLGDFILSASDGPHVSPKYVEQGVPFLSTRHVRAGAITWDDLKFISEADAEFHWRKCRPQHGDILYTKGGTTGLAATVKTDRAFAVWVHIALLKPNPAVVESTWLESMLNSEYCYRQSQVLTHGIANRDLGLTRMVRIHMYAPPLSAQREFARCAAALESLETAHGTSMSTIDALFRSVQHRAFRGEL